MLVARQTTTTTTTTLLLSGVSAAAALQPQEQQQQEQLQPQQLQPPPPPVLPKQEHPAASTEDADEPIQAAGADKEQQREDADTDAPITTAGDEDEDEDDSFPAASSSSDYDDDEDDDGSPPSPYPSSESSESSSSLLLLLCTADGSLYSVDAWTGEHRSRTGTPGLIRRSTAASSVEGEDDSTGVLLPGLDGRLYWQAPLDDEEEDDDDPDDDPDDGGDSRNNNNNNNPQRWKPLDITIHSLLAHPVQSCGVDDDSEDGDGDEENEDDCGILSATVETSLLALDEHGRLRWETVTKTAGAGGGGGGGDSSSTPEENTGDDNNDQDPDGGESDHDDTSSSSSSNNDLLLLLQRKDYRILQVSRRTGQPSWNVSLGTWQALEFEEEDEDDDDELLIDHDDEDEWNLPFKGENSDTKKNPHGSKNNGNNGKLPAIVFLQGGRTLLAVDPQTRSVLWKMETSSVLASVFGISNGRWKTLDVVSSDDLDLDLRDDGSRQHWLALPATASPTPQQQQAMAEEAVHELLWKQQTTQSPLWWYTQQQQQKQRRREQQRALPGREPSSLESHLDDDDINNRQQPQQCPNVFFRSTFLGLPGPPPSVATAAAAAAANGGIFISWPVVTAVVAFWLLLLFVARRVYLHKKHVWFQQYPRGGDTTAQQKGTQEDNDRRMRSLSLEGGALEVRRRTLTRSHSLPDAHALEQPSPPRPHKLSKRTLTTGLVSTDPTFNSPSPGTTTTTPTAPAAAASAAADAAAQQPLTTSLGGIPLVRYSRYASEFEEVEALGKGGFGTVFKCRNVLDAREYAVKKVVLVQRSRDEAWKFQQRLERVLREVKSLAVLDHPHIVRYYTAWLELDNEDSKVNTRHGSTSSAALNDGDDDDNTWSSRCHSSSLMTESVSEWRPRSTNNTFWNKSLSSSSRRLPPPTFHRRARSFNDDDDIGFIFEASDEDDTNGKQEEEHDSADARTSSATTAKGATNGSTTGKNNDSVVESPVQALSNSNSPTSTLQTSLNKKKVRLAGEADSASAAQTDAQNDKDGDKKKTPPHTEEETTTHRHTLYIQMQLCSQKTLHDFLSSRTEVDLGLSLRLFLQACQAVQHVHEQGLIHRDLKPLNVFLFYQENGLVAKVGDFGLSRETSGSTNAGKEEEEDETERGGLHDDDGGDDNHTAGVGTRSYASPEQMNGSDYDSSTDVYSLGIILFELCYRMSTSMERNICLTRLRQKRFPDDWEQLVGAAFPTLKGLIESMLSTSPSARPTASSVAQHARSLFDFTILDERRHRGRNDVLLLRVEAEHREDALGRTLQAIQEASSSLSLLASSSPQQGEEERQQQQAQAGPVQVLQYGLCSSDDGSSKEQPAVMEFALKFEGKGSDLVSQLLERPEIYKVRQVHTKDNDAGNVD